MDSFPYLFVWLEISTVCFNFLWRSNFDFLLSTHTACAIYFIKSMVCSTLPAPDGTQCFHPLLFHARFLQHVFFFLTIISGINGLYCLFHAVWTMKEYYNLPVLRNNCRIIVTAESRLVYIPQFSMCQPTASGGGQSKQAFLDQDGMPPGCSATSFNNLL